MDKVYYYFITGSQDVFERPESPEELTKDYPQFEPLTEEEVAYHLEHPDAKKWFIKNALLPQPEPVEPTPPTEEEIARYKKMRIEELSRRSLDRREELLPSYQIVNAQISLLEISEGREGIYDEAKAKSVLMDANRLGTLCRNEYYRLATAIDLAETIEQVDEIVKGALFDSINFE